LNSFTDSQEAAVNHRGNLRDAPWIWIRSCHCLPTLPDVVLWLRQGWTKKLLRGARVQYDLHEELSACCFDWLAFTAFWLSFSSAIGSILVLNCTRLWGNSVPQHSTMAFPGNWKRHGRIHCGPGPCKGPPLAGYYAVSEPSEPSEPSELSNCLEEERYWWSWGDRQTAWNTPLGRDWGSCRHHALPRIHESTSPRMPPAELSHSLALNFSFSNFLLFSFPPCIPPWPSAPCYCSNS
jgi:hypothetical protein